MSFRSHELFNICESVNRGTLEKFRLQAYERSARPARSKSVALLVWRCGP